MQGGKSLRKEKRTQPPFADPQIAHLFVCMLVHFQSLVLSQFWQCSLI